MGNPAPLQENSHTQCFQLTQGVGNTASLQEKSHSMLSAHTTCGQSCTFTGKQSHSVLSAHTRCGQYRIFSLYTKTWPYLKLSACMKCAQPCTFTGKQSHSKLSVWTRCGRLCTFTGKWLLKASSLHEERWSHSKLSVWTRCGRLCTFTEKWSHSKCSACMRHGHLCTFTGKLSLAAFSLHETWASLHLYREIITRSFQLAWDMGISAPLQKNDHSKLSACMRCGQLCTFTEKWSLKAFSLHEVWQNCMFTKGQSHTVFNLQHFQLPTDVFQ